MANQKHLEILGRGTKHWNEWRLELFRETEPIFQKLCDTVLNDFSDAVLNNADLSDAKLRDADLSGADLRNIDLHGVNFSYADLSYANLSGANLSGADLSRANLSGANLSGANLRVVDLSYAILSGSANLSRADLSRASLRSANLHGANLSGAILVRANLSSANLRSANLSGTDLREACFFTANLWNSNLTNAHLTGANIYGAFRDEWKISHTTCDYIFLDQQSKKRIPPEKEFEKGEFERLFGNDIIEIEYPDGMKPYQYHSFPIMIKMLQDKFGDKCTLTFRSMRQDCGSCKVHIVISDINNNTTKSIIDEEIKKSIKIIEDEYKERLICVGNKLIETESLLFDVYKTTHKRQIESGKHIDGVPYKAEKQFLAVFLSDLKGYSRLSEKDRHLAVDEIREHFSIQLKRYKAYFPPNTWGDAVFAGFEDPIKALECLLKIQKIMTSIGYEIRVGMDRGDVRITYNELLDRPDADGNCINFAARLEPLCETGKVLISENFYRRLLSCDHGFSLEKREVVLKKGADGIEAGETITAYLVAP